MENRQDTQHKQEDKFLNALAEAYRLQEAILNATAQSIITVSPEGIITAFNKSAETLLGYRAEEVIGQSAPMLFHNMEEIMKREETLAKELGHPIEPLFDVFIINIKNTRKKDEYEWTMYRKDRTSFPALVSLACLFDDHDTLLGYAATVTDLTEKKKTEAQAAASEQKFKILAENIPGAIYLCHNDDAYSMIYINDQIEGITGYTAQQFITREINIASLFHADDSQHIHDTITQALADKKSFKVTYRIKHLSGEWRWIDETGIGVYIGGELQMLEGFISDATAQKQAEENLRQVAEENRRVFNNPVNLNAIAGFDGRFTRVSPSWTQLLGWSEEELLSHSFVYYVHPEDREATLNAASFMAEGNNLLSFENRFQCKDGSYKWLLWSSACDVTTKQVYTSAIDITERKKSEEETIRSKQNLEALSLQLQKQNRQLDEFAHVISHNLRSPIGNIQALINLLDGDSSVRDYRVIFEKLKNVAKNLGDTMNDLMETIKVKTSTNVERVEIRFKDVLDKIVQSLEGDLIHAEASVTYDFNVAPIIHYPKAYLESIFQNLLSNAIKYASPDRKPTIRFETRMVEGGIELRVMDNGLGIDMDRYGDKLFGLHKTFHEHTEARGVGLFLIKTQIEAMGGTITAESEVDKGSTFIIKFAV